MKKLFLFAATAMLFAACSNEEVATPQLAQDADDGAVGFDVYVPGATQSTRSGRTNVMTTGTLQKTGFGIFGYQTDNTGYAAGSDIPNYMWNQQVFYNSTAAGWYYAPLKYWPNETQDDSQTFPTNPAGMPDQPGTASYIDKLTFFAYAPWVKSGDTGGTAIVNPETEPSSAAVGIRNITGKDGKVYNGAGFDAVNDPCILYQAATDPNESVDLLWGVAAAGGLKYTSVSKTNPTVSIDEGKPLIDLWKPATNTNLKFMFQHALARVGVKIVLAADQIAAGGDFDFGNTKVTVEDVTIKGPYGVLGILNLNNTTKNEARWLIKTTGETDGNAIHLNAANNSLAAHLRYDADKNTSHEQQVVTGVTTELADAIQVSSTYDANYPDDYVTKETKPEYSATTPYFATQANLTTPTYAIYDNWAKESNQTYFYKYETNQGVSYTNITSTIRTDYPNATFWGNDGKKIYSIETAHIHAVTDKDAVKDYTAYRLVGNTYTQTGRQPEVGDYVLGNTKEETPVLVNKPKTTTTDYYYAKPNYFMVIPTNDTNKRTLKVKITYYVSTTDASLKDGIIYTKNEVEKDIVLPHLKNGIAYNLKLILGLTSVKVEAEVADWTTTEGVVNLPQNTSE